MTPAISRRRFAMVVAGAGLWAGGGCGTVLHPERRGQPAGPLDWKIVALDAVGLLLFFVPGVIAFAVDFSNGTIYLPPDQYGGESSADRSLTSIQPPVEELTVAMLEQVVSRHTGERVRLTPGAYQTETLADIAEFWQTADRLARV